MFATSSQNTQLTTQSTTYLGDLGKGYKFTEFLPKNNQIKKNQEMVNENQELDEDQFQKQFYKMIKFKQDYNNIYKFYLENEKLDTRFEYKMNFIQYLTKCDHVSNDIIQSFLNNKCSSTSIEWRQFKLEILNCLIEQELEIINLTQEPEIIDLTYDTESEYVNYEEENSKDYCNICNDILLNHIYGNVCKKHIPSYALHDLGKYDEMTLKELDTLPSKNTKINNYLLRDSLKFFQESKIGMSINEKTLVFITLFKNGCSCYLNDTKYDILKECILKKCNEIIYDHTILKNVSKQFQKKIISYIKKIKKML